MDEFVNVGAHPENLHDGRVIAVGEEVKLSADEQKQPLNSRLIEEGVFLRRESGKQKKTGGETK